MEAPGGTSTGCGRPLQPVWPLVRRVWFATSWLSSCVWFGVYMCFGGPFGGSITPSYLLLTHAVLISLLVPKTLAGWHGDLRIMLRPGAYSGW